MRTSALGPQMELARAGCAAVVADAGRLLVLGGEDGSACHDSTEILDLEAGAFAPGPPMLARREGCAAVAVDL